MSRGRLINKFLATFEILDTASTVYDTDYHDLDFNNNSVRAETEVVLPCQVEDPSWFRATFKHTGLEQDGEFSLILHYADIELMGLLDANNKSTINIGTRLSSISTDAGIVLNSFPNPPGLYVTQAKDNSFGLSMDNSPTRNLLFLLLAPRPQAI
jgi:hypothetical protein